MGKPNNLATCSKTIKLTFQGKKTLPNLHLKSNVTNEY